ncbi:MAG TPA: hypothetical protein VHW09_02800 [Bryobacteraceae bacterium]|jgi:hypothetical protein|nr:hypothetical protein [Bryobacteraceae bacterium]
MKSRIRWGRVIMAALISEVAVMALMMTILGAWVLFARNGSPGGVQQIGQAVGFYVAPPASGLATFLSARWATRQLSANFVLNGTMVGVVTVILTLGFLFGARPEDRLMYLVSFVIRLAGGYLGGWSMQSRTASTLEQVR